MTEPTPFTHIPILPLSHALDPATKPAFLADLRDALLNVGFLYLSETGLPKTLVEDVVRECRHFFEDLSTEEKEKIEMKNERSFLGWSRVSGKIFNFFLLSTLLLSISCFDVHIYTMSMDYRVRCKIWW